MRTLAAAALLGAATVGAVLAVGALRPAAVPAKPPPRVFAFLSREDGLELRRLAQVGRRISVLAPNWYELDVASGTIREPWDRAPVLAAARRADVPLWPVVNARTGGSAVLDDPAARERIARAIARVASNPAYAGVTLDIEELLAGQRASYTALVRRVAELLGPRRRRLAVYAPRPTAGGSALAYDWPALAAAADLLLVATYNETGPAGPPGPLDTGVGFAQVLAQAQAVSLRRIAPILGAFGYAWPLAGGRGELISSVEANRRRVRCGAPRSVADGGASYSCDGAIVHHATLDGLRERARTAGAAGFDWIALFSLGREPRGLWDELAPVRR